MGAEEQRGTRGARKDLRLGLDWAARTQQLHEEDTSSALGEETRCSNHRTSVPGGTVPIVWWGIEVHAVWHAQKYFHTFSEHLILQVTEGRCSFLALLPETNNHRWMNDGD